MDNMSIIRGHTRKQVLHLPDIPDALLMIGSAEQLDGIMLRIPQTIIPKEVAKSVRTLTETVDNTTLMQAISDNLIEIDDISTNVAILNAKLGV